MPAVSESVGREKWSPTLTLPHEGGNLLQLTADGVKGGAASSLPHGVTKPFALF
jgi:hypothetical protein